MKTQLALLLLAALSYSLLASAQAPPGGAGGTSGVSAGSAPAKLPPGHPAVGTPAPAASGSLPPGHPSVAGAEPAQAGNLPPGHPAVGTTTPSTSGELPPGHPSVATDGAAAEADDAGAGAKANPHGGLDPEAIRDVVDNDPKVPRGSVHATIVDASGAPMKGIEVALVKSFQSIAMGDHSDSVKAKTNASGQVEFKNLNVGRSYSYEVAVKRGAAEYSSTPFTLNRESGENVLLHVFPVTHDINQARVAMRGLIYVQPREDVFQFEAWFQVYNVGEVTWVPNNVSLELPTDAKAFTAQTETGDTRFENPTGQTVTLHGTFVPGRQNDVRFSFQVPNEQTQTASFEFPLPPHVAEFRVIVESAPGMGLSARGFPQAQVSTGARGERVLVTQKRGMGLDRVHFQVTGLPTRGSAPWIAVFLALGIAAGGLSTAFSGSDPGRKRRQVRGDRREARNKILEELVALDRARREDRIGPRTYDETRRALLTALARLLEPAAN